MKKITMLLITAIFTFVLFGCGTTTYTVTFDDSFGNTTTQTVNQGTTATPPTDPEQLGYEFVDWYTDEDWTTAFNFNTEIEENTIVYAGWNYLFTPLTGLTQTVFDEIQAGYELWYRIEVTETTRLNIYTTGNTDLYGYILDEDELMIDEDDDSFDYSGNFQFIWDFQPGTYYIVVQGYDDTTAGTFNLEIREITNITSVYSESTTLEANGYVSFTFDVTVAGYYHVFTLGEVDTYGWLLDLSENVLFEDDDSGYGTNCYMMGYLGIGTYEFYIEGFDATTAGAFDIVVERTN